MSWPPSGRGVPRDRTPSRQRGESVPMSRPIVLTALLAFAAGSASAQAGPRAAWRLVFDSRPPADTAAPFVTMAPGWHAIAGSGMLAFDTANSWRGDDSL